MDAPGGAIAVLLRIFLRHTSFCTILMQRVEIITPANSLMQVQEGLQLLRLHVSPYAGSTYHLPPLLLNLAALPARLPNVASAVLDVATAYVLDRITRKCLLRSGPDQRGSGEIQRLAAFTYLWHPFNILSCVAGSSSTYDSFFLCLAVFGALSRNPPLAAFALAVASYLTMHPFLLLLPLAILIATGAEDLTCCFPASTTNHPPSQSKTEPSSSPAHVTDQLPPTESPPSPPQPQLLQSTSTSSQPIRDPQQPHHHRDALPSLPPSSAKLPQPWLRLPSKAAAASFLLWFLTWCLALGLLSDISIRAYPQHMCLLPHLPPSVLHLLPAHLQLAQAAAGSGQAPPGSSCWMRHTYGFLLDVTDHTPNIGFFWYFFQEMFPNFRTFFKFVFHSHSVIFLLPLAIILPHRPLFLTFAQLMISAMFKPYPAVGDLALYTSLLPLFASQLQHSSYILFLLNALLLLLVLGPAMWQQWIVVESANANFFYSITLLFGLWQTMLFVHMLSLTLRLDDARSKAVQGSRCPEADANAWTKVVQGGSCSEPDDGTKVVQGGSRPEPDAATKDVQGDSQEPATQA